MYTYKGPIGPKLASELIDSVQVRRLIIEKELPVLESIAKATIDVLQRGRRVMLLGNRESAAEVRYIASALVDRLQPVRRASQIIVLAVESSHPIPGADEESAQAAILRLEETGTKGDLLIAICAGTEASGVLKAVKLAREMGMVTVGLTGQHGVRLKNSTDLCFRVPSQSRPRIQEAHISVAHAFCSVIEHELVEPPVVL